MSVRSFRAYSAAISAAETSCVWIPHEDHVWCPARYIEQRNQDHVCQTFDGDYIEIPIKKYPVLEPVIPSTISTIQSNLISLDDFAEGAILHQIKERYNQDEIYTSVGSILVSVNPFKLLPIYSFSIINSWKNAGPAERAQMPPHIFGIAANAMNQMQNNSKNQSVVISGDSGAGKTEATKLILRYISEVAGGDSGAEQRILQSNPVLEAFGNSKTLRNDNSSRFGKWMEIGFNSKGKVCGARVINYLLEATRVSFVSEGERNYHVFYQLCAGAPADMKAQFHIRDATHYIYTNASGCIEIPNVDDCAEFSGLFEAMKGIGFTEDEHFEIMRVIASILHIGNLEFESVNLNSSAGAVESEGSGLKRDCLNDLKNAADTLMVDADVLKKSICFRESKFGSETVYIPNKIADAESAKEALSKALYSKLFDWIVKRVNDSLYNSKGVTNIIGVLDIFGFEIFEVNSFEQFCINYANEKLQQNFNDHIFKMEQDEYRREGINIDAIEYSDNQLCLDLIEKRPTGIIPVLNEQIRMPRATDSTFINKIHKNHGDRRKGHPFYATNVKKPMVFIIKHYAADVEYTVDGFLEKNKDTMHDALKELVKSSKIELVRKMFSLDPALLASSRSNKNKSSITSKFMSQLNDLSKILRYTEPHYIRCIKPNDLKEANTFQSPMVLKQMRNSGLFETIKIRRMGFCFRMTHSDFIYRYSLCAPSAVMINSKRRRVDASQICVNILKSIADLVPEGAWRNGSRKIFLKEHVRPVLDSLRIKRVTQTVVLIQCLVRGFISRRRFQKLIRLHRQILIAMRERSYEKLQSIFDQNDFDVDLAGDSEIVSVPSARVLLKRLVKEKKIGENLKRSMKSDNVHILEGAIQQVSALGAIDEAVWLMKLLQEAQETLKTLVAVNHAKRLLRSAIDLVDITMLEDAVKKAKEAGIDGKSDELYLEAVQAIGRLNGVSPLSVPSNTSDMILAEGFSPLQSDRFNSRASTLSSCSIPPPSTEHPGCFDSFGAPPPPPPIDDINPTLKAELLDAMRGSDMERLKFVLQQTESEGVQVPEMQTASRLLERYSQAEQLLKKIQLANSKFDLKLQRSLLGEMENLQIDSKFSDFELQTLNDTRKNVYGMSPEEYYRNHLKVASSSNDTSKMRQIVMMANECGEDLGPDWEKESKEAMMVFSGRSAASGVASSDAWRVFKSSGNNNNKSTGKNGGIVGGDMNGIFSKEFKVFCKTGFNWMQFDNIRTLGNFAKRHYTDKKKLKSGMFLWTKEALPRSLYAFESKQTIVIEAASGVKDETVTLNRLACDLFKTLQAAMGDIYHQYPASMAHEYAVQGWRYEGIRDELYLQIMKQTSGNPRIESTIKGWKMLQLCLSSFPPSEKLKFYLYAFIIRTNEKEGIHEVVQNVSNQVLATMEHTLENGSAKAPPTLEMAVNLFENKSFNVEVHLTDGTVINVAVLPKDAFMRATELVDLLISMLQLSDEIGDSYGLYDTCATVIPDKFLSEKVMISEAETRLLGNNDVIFDVIRSWKERKPLQRNISRILLFKKVIFDPYATIPFSCLRMVQGQLAGDLAAGLYMITPLEAAYTVALQILMIYGSIKRAVSFHSGSLKVLLSHYLPAIIRKRKELVWWDHVIHEYTQVLLHMASGWDNDVDGGDAMENSSYEYAIEFITTMKTFPSFGTIVFRGMKGLNDISADVHLIALSYRGIDLLDVSGNLLRERVELMDVLDCKNDCDALVIANVFQFSIHDNKSERKSRKSEITYRFKSSRSEEFLYCFYTLAMVNTRVRSKSSERAQAIEYPALSPNQMQSMDEEDINFPPPPALDARDLPDITRESISDFTDDDFSLPPPPSMEFTPPPPPM